jgi:L-aminoadipate-semialdehyde dehydrogenase
MRRIKENMMNHLLWRDSTETDRVGAVCGNLDQENLGLSEQKFKELSNNVDCVIHNGAFVHWVFPYEKLKAPNVDGTMEALRLACTGKSMKPFYFISSTSVLDTSHYADKGSSVLESDNLEGSRIGLSSGYAQSKWVAEKRLMLAKSKYNLPIAIVRPGYIIGDTNLGVTNTDDFIWRLCKGCVELGQAPRMSNIVNMCPVDFVADLVTQVIWRGLSAVKRQGVFHVWNPTCVRFTDLFESLQRFYSISFVPYLDWREALMKLTVDGGQTALFPLLHFVLDDLPTSTKAPVLDWRNMRWAFTASDSAASIAYAENAFNQLTLTPEVVSKYLTYLCKVGFMPSNGNERLKELLANSSDEWNHLTLLTRTK